MRIDIITVLPEMLEGFVNCSILARAQKKGWPKSISITFATIRSISGAGWTIIPTAVLRGW